jgi:putative FmdB family regulatory protein
MPAYDFRCDKCGAVRTEVRKVDDRNDPVPACECGGTFERAYDSAPGIAFKGYGWTPKFYR